MISFLKRLWAKLLSLWKEIKQKRILKSKALEQQLSNALDELKRQTGEIKSLQEDLKEAEESLDRANRYEVKYREKRDELNQLEHDFRKQEKETTRVKKELVEKENTLEQISTSLSFVQKVLKANVVSTENYNEQEKKIDKLYDFIKTDLQGLYKQYSPIQEDSERIFGDTLEEWNVVYRKSWIRNKKAIAFIGEFSAGKTTIVNRILSQGGDQVALLPTDARPTTAIPTYISGGPKTAYRFYSKDGELKEIDKTTFAMVNKEVLANVEGVSNLIKYFIMTYDNPLLEGMSILDTPGFNSDDKEDTKRTIDVINECDALFWVMDAHTGTITASSLEIIKEKLKIIKENMKRPLFVVINRADEKAESELKKIECLINKTFEDEGIKIKKCIRFSKFTPLDELMGIIESIEKSSSAKEYLEDLEHEFIPKFIKECKDEYKKAKRDWEEINKQCRGMWGDIKKECKSIEDNGERIDNLPLKKKKGLFKKRQTRKMNESEIDKMEGYVDEIDNSISDLEQKIMDYGELSKKLQEARDEKNKKDAVCKQVGDAGTKLKYLKKDIIQ